MAQHDYNLANQSGADFRADLNNALEAIATVNSGATEPSTTFAHQLWVDTSSSVLKIRNAADSDWITLGTSITTSNTFTGDLTGNVTGNVTGSVTGDVTGDLTGNADSADILSTARTIQISGDVAGSASFDGSGDINIATTVQIDSIVLGTDTQGDYIESISGSTGVTITGGTGEGSTPTVAIGQPVATTDDVTFNIVTATNEFVGDLDGAVRFTAKTDEGLSKGDIVYVSGVSGNTTTVGKAKADDASKMPAFGMAIEDANANNNLQIVTFGNLTSIDTSNESVGQILYVSTTAGEYTTTAPTGESSQIQNIGKVLRSHAVNGSIKVGGAGRSNATPNLDNGKIFIGNGSNQSATSTLDTSIVPENTNLYWTTARGESMFDTRLATKDTGDLTEGSNLYYTTARVNSDFDTRLAIKDTDSLSEGTTNLYYTTARVDSNFDTRLATKDTGDLTEGSNLYYTTARVNSDFDTRLATKSTSDLSEGTNLYYTDARFDTRLATKDTDDLTEGTNLYYTSARFDSAFTGKSTSDLSEGTNLYYTDARANSAIDTRVTKTFVDALSVIAGSVQANSVALGTDTTGNYIQTVTGTANKITVSGSGSESADVTITLPDDVQIADSLTVAGNLTVNGTLTSLDTTNLDIEDNLFQLNAGLTGSPVNDSGMLINRGNQDNGIFMWDESADKFTLGLTTADGSATGNITLAALGTLVANIEGNVTGNVTGQVSTLSNHDTADLAEGTNLYYTDARADARVNLQTGANLDLSSKSTSDLSEGTNEYFTTARARSSISATGDLSYNSSTGVISFTASASPVTSVNTLTGAVVLTTANIGENTNLYYTDARARAAISESSTQLAYNSTTGVLTFTQGDTDTVSEGTSNLYYTTSRFDSAFSGKTTSNLTEGTNLYYTDARAEAVSINNVVEDTTPQLGGDLASNGNDILFADSDKAIFGAGSDLEIYHDGSNSYIKEDGNGNLIIAADDFRVTNVAVSEIMISADTDGVVKLYHNNAVKLFTTSTGIDVTGTATMDELTVDGSSTLNGTVTINANTTSLILNENDETDENTQLLSAGGTFRIRTRSDDGSTNTERFRVSHNTGDISFYDDTGSTQGLFWDASAESLGIGTSNPPHKLSVFGSGAGNATVQIEGESGADPYINFLANNTQHWSIGIDDSDSDKFKISEHSGLGTNDYLVVDTSGNVGINTTSPTQKLDVNGTVELNNLTVAGQQGTDGQVLTSTGSGVAWEASSGTTINNNADNRIITGSGTADTLNGESGLTYDGSTLAVTGDANFDSNTLFVDASASKVGVGMNSPAYNLEIWGAADPAVRVYNTGTGTSDDSLLRLQIAGTSARNFIYFGDSGDSDIGKIEYNHSDNSMRFTANTAEAFRVHNTGAISVGSAEVYGKFNVEGSINFNGNIRPNANSSGGSASAPTICVGYDNDTGFFHPAANTIGITTLGSERVRINSSGSVGIGTTSPSQSLEVVDSDNYKGIHIRGSNVPCVTFAQGTSTTPAWRAGLSGYDGSAFAIATGASVGDRFHIKSAGHVLINTTTLQGAGGLSFQVGGNNVVIESNTTSSAGNGTEYQVFRRNSSQIGSITMNGTTAVQYNTSSDYRLKENVVTEWDATTRLKQLRPSRFNFITEPNRTVDGFLAHEVQAIVPEAIAGNKDAMQSEEYEVTPAVLDDDGNVVTEAEMGTREVPKYQGIDQSKLVPLLVKTIQELEARITALES